MKEIERELGEPLTVAIPRLLTELGSMPAVAQHIRISLPRLFDWCKANGIEKRSIWVKRGETVATQQWVEDFIASIFETDESEATPIEFSGDIEFTGDRAALEDALTGAIAQVIQEQN